jgi:hypothetical protein
VTKKVKVNPGWGAAALAATEYTAIKLACQIQVGDVESEMKQCLHGSQDNSPKLRQITRSSEKVLRSWRVAMQ